MDQHTATPKPLLWEVLAGKLMAWIREDRVPFCASILIGFLSYGFTLTNKLINQDEVHYMFTKGATYSSGRWGLSLLELIFPNHSLPWIYGVIAILILALSVCLILRIFQIRNKLLQVLLAGGIMAFPSQIGTMALPFTSAPYAISFLMAVTAVWLMQKNRLWSFLLACALMIFSLSIYQSYITIAATLLVLLLVQALLRGEDVLPVIRRGFVYLGFLVLSMGFYYVSFKALNRILGVSLNTYAQTHFDIDLASLPQRVLLAYQSFFHYFTQRFWGLIPTDASLVFHCGCFCITGILLLIWGCQTPRKSLGRFLLLAALLALMPLAINALYLCFKYGLHTLVMFSFTSCYVLFIIVADICLSLPLPRQLLSLCSRFLLHGLTFFLAAIVVINIFVANEVYLRMHIQYENTYRFYSSLANDIQNMPEFDESTKLAVIGSYQPPDYTAHFHVTNYIFGATGLLPDSSSKGSFMEIYLGLPIPLASDEELSLIAASQEFQEMALYPYYGSIRLIGDTVVVKLSE